uniref:Eco57I restriction-modification methylase domain-containing protein n=1 Tax=Flavobacterium sp. TaxID=239 RepID=UPI00286A23FF
ARLRDLFSYSENANPFNEKETKSLIEAINNCKILDPACGSGAFPMGVLHKMVHILTKLDNGNKLWRELQKQKAIQEMETAYQIVEKAERKKRLDEIDDVFDNNASDYGRKLYLIENCIYGIDIQPIAVQIAKLRFFISLIIDQNVSPSSQMENMGIRPLPNLETKFVAANSLIGLDKPEQGMFRNPEIEGKEKQLKDLRHNYFTAKTRKDKIRLQDADKTLRKEIAKLLEDDGWNTTVAKQIVAFDPYDQNLSAPFFESEWMFGLIDGFDIVIGNPPYGAKFSDEEKLYFKNNYKYQDYQPESFLFFTEKSFEFLKINGVLSFIIPNTWLTNLKLIKIRKFLTSNNVIQNISHYHKSVFDAVVDTEVVIFKKGFVANNMVKIFNHIDAEQLQELKHNQNTWKEKNGDVINIFTNPKIEKLVEKLKTGTEVLSFYCVLYSGVKPYEIGKGVPPQTQEILKNRVYDSASKKNSSYKKVLRGSDIGKYVNNWNGERWIKYGDNLAAPRKPVIFSQPKIVIRQTGDSLIATFDDEEFICLNNTHVINQKIKVDLKYMLALINSTLLNFYFQYLNPETGEALAEVKKETEEKLLIKKAKDQKPFITLVDKILSAKEKDPKADTSKLEKQLDEMVYKLYELTEEEIAIIENKK